MFGTKIGKIIRLVRLIRLLRIMKALSNTNKKIGKEKVVQVEIEHTQSLRRRTTSFRQTGNKVAPVGQTQQQSGLANPKDSKHPKQEAHLDGKCMLTAAEPEPGANADVFKNQEYQLYRRRLSSEMAGRLV